MRVLTTDPGPWVSRDIPYLPGEVGKVLLGADRQEGLHNEAVPGVRRNHQGGVLLLRAAFHSWQFLIRAVAYRGTLLFTAYLVLSVDVCSRV
jgi:hypothetical protein